MRINIFKIWAIIILIGAGWAIYKSTVTPIEDIMTIQTFLFYILIAWALFGMYFVVRYMNEDFYKEIEKKEIEMREEKKNDVPTSSKKM